MAKAKRGRWLVWLHRWAGLILAVLLLAQGVTGIMLLHRQAVEDGSRPAVAPVPHSALAASIAKILELNEARVLDRITFARSEDRAPSVRTLGPDGAMHIAYADLAGGTMGPDGSLWVDPAEAALVVHTTLTAGLPGFLVVAIEGLLLVFIAISGLIVWWPAAGRLVASLTIRSKTGARFFLFDLHRTAGAITSVFLIVSGLTGALMIFEPLLKPLVAQMLPVEEEPAIGAAVHAQDQWMSREAALQQALNRFPDAALRQVRVAGEGQRVVLAIFDTPPSGLEAQHQMIGIDRDGGAMVMEHVAGHAMAGDAVFEALLPLHNGTLAGEAGRWIMTLIGIGLIMLTLSGVAHFILLRVQRRRMRRRQS